MRITSARQRRREDLVEWVTRSQDGIRISHSVFRHCEQCFPEVQYFQGVPFVPWKALQAKLSSTLHGLIDVIATYLKERLIVDGSGPRTLSTSAIRREDISHNEKSFFRLEYFIKEERMFNSLTSLMNDWYKGTLYPGLVGNDPSRAYAVHHGPFVVCYKTPPFGTPGIYVLYCGSTFSFNNKAYDGPFYILKIGQSIDIAERALHHKASSSMLASIGAVKFPFGLELKGGDRNDAETLLKVKLTDLGFSQFTVSDYQGRTTETFVFNGKSLPLVHDVVCGIRFVYPLPTPRVNCNHANSIENPLREQDISPQTSQSVSQPTFQLNNSGHQLRHCRHWDFCSSSEVQDGACWSLQDICRTSATAHGTPGPSDSTALIHFLCSITRTSVRAPRSRLEHSPNSHNGFVLKTQPLREGGVNMAF